MILRFVRNSSLVRLFRVLVADARPRARGVRNLLRFVHVRFCCHGRGHLYRSVIFIYRIQLLMIIYTKNFNLLHGSDNNM